MDLATIQGELGQGQAAVVMNHYPHMLYLDRLTWTGFLRVRGPEIERCWYDVLVGSPIETAEDASPSDVRLARGTGCKRIDVVIWWGGRLAVVEVKPFGNHAALGQGVLYRDLFMRDYQELSPVLGMIVCREADPDLGASAARLGLEVYAVGEGELPVSPGAEVRRD